MSGKKSTVLYITKNTVQSFNVSDSEIRTILEYPTYQLWGFEFAFF